MKYLLLLYGDESAGGDASPEDLQRMMDAYAEFDRESRAAGVFLAGEGLEPTSAATTLRIREGETVHTDGPFAETREQLGGFYLLECQDLDEALGWAAKIPAAYDGSIEVRPVMNYEAYGYQPGDSEQASA